MCCIVSVSWLIDIHCIAHRSGTANRILEAKEKERKDAVDDTGKGKEKEKSRKKAKRYDLSCYPNYSI